MFGLYNIRKPAGPTSHDIVARVRRQLPRGTKVGHAGTLDPFADGVLVLCVGAATRLVSYVQAQPKRYLTEITFGATSTTDDVEGELTPAGNWMAMTQADVALALERFVGDIEQVPPAHSAVHVDGQRAYKLARRGQQVHLPARRVSIHSIELLHFEPPRLDIALQCSTGTYIRALARDLGEALQVGGYCSRLTRSAIGEFTIERAIEPEALDLDDDLLPARLAVAHLPHVHVKPDAVARLAQGKFLDPAQDILNASAFEAAEDIALLDEAGKLLALACMREGALRPTKVFVPTG